MTFDSNCPIQELHNGKCWHWCPSGICPKHGNVQKEIAKYRTTKELTLETELVQDLRAENG